MLVPTFLGLGRTLELDPPLSSLLRRPCVNDRAIGGAAGLQGSVDSARPVADSHSDTVLDDEIDDFVSAVGSLV